MYRNEDEFVRGQKTKLLLTVLILGVVAIYNSDALFPYVWIILVPMAISIVGLSLTFLFMVFDAQKKLGLSFYDALRWELRTQFGRRTQK